MKLFSRGRLRAKSPTPSVVYRTPEDGMQARFEELQRQNRLASLSLSGDVRRLYRRRFVRSQSGRGALSGLWGLCAASLLGLGLLWGLLVSWVLFLIFVVRALRRTDASLREAIEGVLLPTHDRAADIRRLTRPLSGSLLEFASKRAAWDIASVLFFGAISAALFLGEMPGFPLFLFVVSYSLSVRLFRLPGLSAGTWSVVLLFRQLVWLACVQLLPAAILVIAYRGGALLLGSLASLCLCVILFRWFTRQAAEEELLMCQKETEN